MSKKDLDFNMEEQFCGQQAVKRFYMSQNVKYR